METVREHAGPAQAGITVRPCSDGDAWEAYLREHDDASFYQRLPWRRINEATLGHRTHYLEARAGSAVVGVLPLVRLESRLFGRILCSMPFVNFGGPVADSPQAEAALVDAARALAHEHAVDYLELRCRHRLDTDMPVSLRKVGMTLALDPDPETLWAGFKSKHRTNIRRVYKHGIEVRSEPGAALLDPFYDLLARNWREHGTPVYRKRLFRDISEVFGDDVRIFVAYHGDTPVAAAFNGHFRDTVEGMWAASPAEYRGLQPNYVLYWEMIHRACLDGFRRYHLGRSTADSDAEQFKRKWNADSEQLYWYYHRPRGGEMPQLNVDNPRYALAIRAWRRLPLAVTRLIGPPLAKQIP